MGFEAILSFLADLSAFRWYGNGSVRSDNKKKE